MSRKAKRLRAKVARLEERVRLHAGRAHFAESELDRLRGLVRYAEGRAADALRRLAEYRSICVTRPGDRYTHKLDGELQLDIGPPLVFEMQRIPQERLRYGYRFSGLTIEHTRGDAVGMILEDVRRALVDHIAAAQGGKVTDLPARERRG